MFCQGIEMQENHQGITAAQNNPNKRIKVYEREYTKII